ncbi:hypothetical protein MTR67_036414 [Solanum verrucosum]|uniref:Reverse transcriptase zinc-binding domain-containing protein n=1 Tax=Solanum verrucosum TaxID=315347 RepID=A0AAF0U0Y7_SOLVR|nr:hypothetical protein MTR67_029903 [Solanum verrucosum]WMV43029.1 hypothetical protein MTR67_036414 [Solanum verrucosum]
MDTKRNLVRSRIQQEGVDIIVLVETKLRGEVGEYVQQLGGNRWMGGMWMESLGSKGGILIMWDKRNWKGEPVERGNQSITCSFSGLNQDLIWFITAVYASCDGRERKELWEELGAMRSFCEGPWVVCGDFNTTRFPSEKTNCSRISEAMSDFSSCINELELVDPPLFGGPYTWRGGENQKNASRIDRFLYSFPWDEMFTQIRQSTLPSLGSDHNPIVLICGDEVFKKSYFKFEKWWLNVEGFRDKVKEWWGSFNVTGSPDFILASKLSFLKKKLKEWSKENRGNWRVRKEHLLEQIGRWENIQVHRTLTDDEQLLKAHIAMEYEEVARNEEIHWRQRSRIQWIKNGDKNTKFFHRMATSHKRNNTIESLVINGEESSDPVAIRNEIVDFYQILYKETESWRPSLNILDVQTITEEEQILLSRGFEEEEVLEGIKQCAVDKAPGPDGYTMAFFSVFWETIKDDVMQTFHKFHAHQKGDKTKFWLDDWCGNGILRDLFPILFSICTNTNSKIEEMWSPQGWNIIFRRLLNDWEIDGMVECLGLIGGFPGTTLEPDRLAWGHHKDGVFSVNRLYNWGLKRCAGRSIGPWNTIWKSVAPAKVKCFTWLVARKKCLTHEAMQKRGINIVSRCLLCKEALETNKHLFMHCKVTAQVWALFTSIANEYWTMPEHTSDLLSCWIKRGGSKSQKRWWRTVPACIWWIIWKERNQRIFEGKECTIQKIKWKVITTLGFWCKEQDIEEEIQLVDFIGSL